MYSYINWVQVTGSVCKKAQKCVYLFVEKVLWLVLLFVKDVLPLVVMLVPLALIQWFTFFLDWYSLIVHWPNKHRETVITPNNRSSTNDWKWLADFITTGIDSGALYNCNYLFTCSYSGHQIIFFFSKRTYFHLLDISHD